MKSIFVENELQEILKALFPEIIEVKYEKNDNGEYVIVKYRDRKTTICVTWNSLPALTRNVFKGLGWKP